MTRPASPQEIAAALGGGRQVKTSGGWKTLCPLHNDTNPSLIIYEKGDKDGKPWVQCASCGTTKELYQAIEDKTGMFFQARREAKDFSVENKEPKSRGRLKAIYPAPIPWHPVHLKGKQPTDSWEYYNADDELMFVSARYDFHEGKQFRQYSVVMKSGQPLWHGTNQCNPRPLYNLPELLSADPTTPVLVVEGEKTADYARSMPDWQGVVVVTFAAGSKSWKKTDWSPLKGRKVYLWPDADDVGKAAFVALGKYLWSIAEHVEMASIPPTFPKGWDLADPFPDNWNLRKISWKTAYKPDREFLLQSVTPQNYIEVFDSMYYVYHSSEKLYTISKQYLDHIKGHPVRVDAPSLMMLIGPSHEAHGCCRVMVGEDHFESGLKNWAVMKLQAGEYITDFEFAPNGSEILDGWRWTLNTYTGLPYVPSEDGSCQLFKDFLLDVICAGDKEAYGYIFNFLSHMFQFPEEKPDVALMFNGEKGTGKSFFFGMIQRLLGGSGGYGYSAPSSAIFKGAFNGSYAASTLALFIHEWQNTTSIAIENTIKSFITEDTIEVRIKYRNNYETRSYTRVFGASNHDHMARVTWDERRYSFFNVSNERIQDSEYFEAIEEELKNGGFRRLLHEFMSYKVNHRLIRTIYRNDALAEQKELSKTPAQELAYKMLLEGEIYLRTLDERRDVSAFYHVDNDRWLTGGVPLPATLCTNVILDQHAPRNGEVYKQNNDAVSFSGLLSWMTNVIQRSSCHITRRGESVKVAAKRVPPLETCRKYYADKVGLKYEALFSDDRGTVVDLLLDEPAKKVEDGDVPF